MSNKLIKILMLGEAGSANTQNWVTSLTRFGPAQVEVWSFPKYPSWLRLLYIPIAFLHVRKRINKFKPDVVIGYRTTSYGFIGALTNFQPLVLAAQGESDVWPPGHWSNHISSRMARYAIKKAVLIHAWGVNMVPALLSLGAHQDKIMVMSRGIDLTKFTYRAPFTKENQVVLIASRSLYPEYHHDILLMAFAEVMKEYSAISWKLIIAGDGPLHLMLTNLCTKLGISEYVFFTGKLDSHELSIYLSEADVYVSLPDTEGISSSLLEAMASGCYPIITDLPANREYVNSDENGLLVSLNKDHVAQAILSVISMKEDVIQATIVNRHLVEKHADTRINSSKFILAYRQLF